MPTIAIDPNHQIKEMEITIRKLEEEMLELKNLTLRTRSVLELYINRQFTEIKVREKDGQWGDYSGIFFLNENDEKELVLKKARLHFEKYFKEGFHHKNKELALFITKGKIKHLVEKMKTNKDEK